LNTHQADQALVKESLDAFVLGALFSFSVKFIRIRFRRSATFLQAIGGSQIRLVERQRLVASIKEGAMGGSSG